MSTCVVCHTHAVEDVIQNGMIVLGRGKREATTDGKVLDALIRAE